MKKIKTTLKIAAMIFAILTVQSCGNQEGKKIESMEEHDNSDGHHDHDTHSHSSDENGHGAEVLTNVTKTEKEDILNDYLGLKNALTEDDEKKAKKIAGVLAVTIKGFDSSEYTENQQAEIKDILETSLEHSEHIEKSPIDHQREHFKELSTDMIDLISIIGASDKLYQQYCPMYDNNKGGSWLSTENTIKNPYYGSKMLSCGKVEKEY